MFIFHSGFSRVILFFMYSTLIERQQFVKPVEPQLSIYPHRDEVVHQLLMFTDLTKVEETYFVLV